jgi:hypothetical protein
VDSLCTSECVESWIIGVLQNNLFFCFSTLECLRSNVLGSLRRLDIVSMFWIDMNMTV